MEIFFYRSKKMKVTAKQLMGAVVMAAVIGLGLGSCATTAPSAIAVADVPQPELLNWKNRDMGLQLNDWAPWVKNYVANNSVAALQKLDDYKDYYLIIGEDSGPNLNFINTWANEFNAQKQLSTTLRNAVATTNIAASQGKEVSANVNDPETGKFARAINTTLSASSQTISSGLTKEGDFWTLTRTYRTKDKSKDYTDEYHYFVLYKILKTTLNKLADSALQSTMKQDPALANLASATIAYISKQGIVWGTDTAQKQVSGTSASNLESD
jgi:hypothetical protein